MSDTINREYATRYFIGLQALDKITNDNYDGKITFEEVVSRLGVIPSAQPEIIQCKDCKHWYKDTDSGMSCEYTEMSQPEDGFCNWAERRGDSK